MESEQKPAFASSWPPWEVHAYGQRQVIIAALEKQREIVLTIELGPKTLDLLSDVLGSEAQQKINALTKQVNDLTSVLKPSAMALQDAIDDRKT